MASDEKVNKKAATKEVSKKKPLKKKKKKKSNRGRKSVYDWKVKPKLHIISDWMRNGATEEEVYKKLGISHQTFYRYKKQHSELLEALKTREEADAQVEAALFKRAIGYDYYETISKQRINKDGSVSEEVNKILKHVEPDTTAALAWLNNRRKETWRQKQEQVNTTKATEIDEFIQAVEKSVTDKIKEKKKIKLNEEDDV